MSKAEFNSTRRKIRAPHVKGFHVYRMNLKVTITTRLFWDHWYWRLKCKFFKFVLMCKVVIMKKPGVLGDAFV